MQKQLSLCLSLAFLSSSISAESLILNCKNNVLLFPKQILSTETKDLNIKANYSEIYKDDSFFLKGNVSLNSSTYFLGADEISINKLSKISKASGYVKFQNNELMLTGDKAMIKKEGAMIHTTLNQVKFYYPDLKINGRAQFVTHDGTEQIFNSGSYSLCPLGNSDWQMKADKIILNSTTNKGIAKNVTIEFLGITIFYSPYQEWALEGRSSGFLAPIFGSYNELGISGGSKYQVKIPYYFNIAPDRDFFLILNQLSSRGSLIEGKYRQLITNNNYLGNGRSEIEGHYLLNKDKIASSKRWLLNSKLDLSLNTKTDFSIITNRVSDPNYFKEIAHSNTSDSKLRSYVNLSYKNQKKFNYVFFVESEQLINNGNASYTRVPELSINKEYKGLDGHNIDFLLIGTKFTHKNSNTTTNRTGIRTYAQTKFSRSLKTKNYLITPSLKLSTTNYTMDNAVHQERNIVSFGFNSKFFLERKAFLFDTHLIQTLIPRLGYNYTPKKDQSTLPNFDSDYKNNLYESLFSGQKFTGIDRIASANDLIFGLESDFINKETGSTYLSLKIAQAYQFDNMSMSKNGTLVSQKKYSNVAMSANLTMRDFSFNNSLQYNSITNKISKRNSSISFIINSRKFLTLAHYDDNGNNSVELYSAYPLTQQTHVFAGINGSISNSTINKETMGIAYESCCWAVRLAYFKEYLNENNYDYVTKFELVLKGLATTSSNLYKRLEEDIPNYSVNLNNF